MMAQMRDKMREDFLKLDVEYDKENIWQWKIAFNGGVIMKKVVILDEEEMEVLNKNLAIAYGISNKLDVSGENKRKADHISELIKAAIDVINWTV